MQDFRLVEGVVLCFAFFKKQTNKTLPVHPWEDDHNSRTKQANKQKTRLVISEVSIPAQSMRPTSVLVSVVGPKVNRTTMKT